MADFRRHLTDLVPHEGVYYQHDDFEVRTQNMNPDERENGHAHVKAMLLSATSHAIPVVAGEPAFGTWQRLILFEMDEPKDRGHVPRVRRLIAAGGTQEPGRLADVGIERRKSRQIDLGGRRDRRRRSVSIQSMTTTKTADINATLQQIASSSRPASTSCASRCRTGRTPRPSWRSPRSPPCRSSPTSTSSGSTRWPRWKPASRAFASTPATSSTKTKCG